jgi:hypothetical protein
MVGGDISLIALSSSCLPPACVRPKCSAILRRDYAPGLCAMIMRQDYSMVSDRVKRVGEEGKRERSSAR